MGQKTTVGSEQGERGVLILLGKGIKVVHWA